jgi:hypothetical protein
MYYNADLFENYVKQQTWNSSHAGTEETVRKRRDKRAPANEQLAGMQFMVS